MKLTEFIAEIETSLRKYQQSIDKSTIKFLVISELKKFGLNIALLEEEVIEVRDNRADLPDGFLYLKLALKLQASGFDLDTEDPEFMNSYVFRERIENPMYFDEIQNTYVKTDCPTYITEAIHLPNGNNARFYYDYEWLRLVDGVNKSVIDKECLNLHPSIRNSAKHEINISGSTLHTNFKSGRIYIQFYQLPKEDGEIVIPEYTTGHIVQYMLAKVKAKLAEDIITNDENAQNLVNLLPLWQQEAQMNFKLALNESKFNSLGRDWSKRLKKLNQAETARFTLPNLNFSYAKRVKPIYTSRDDRYPYIGKN